MTHSIDFFDRQFQSATAERYRLNPFEERALPWVRGEVLDYGCGLGNLAVAAAVRGCSVRALDASPAAIDDLRDRSNSLGLPIQAETADLRRHHIDADYDTVVSIGLLMFFDCPTAFRQLADLQRHVRPGGTAIINVLIEGTSYMEMFDEHDHCLFQPGEMRRRFEGWDIELEDFSELSAPGDTLKRFATLIARRPVGVSCPFE